jgi:hypothetical protein
MRGAKIHASALVMLRTTVMNSEDPRAREMASGALKLAAQASRQAWIAIICGMVALAACGLLYVR